MKKTSPFKFALFTTYAKFGNGTAEELGGVENLDAFYWTWFSETWHEHPASSDIMNELIAMTHGSLVAMEDFVRHLEDKDGIQLSSLAVRRKLRWHFGKIIQLSETIRR